MSSDITAIQARISGLEFNGPSYDSHSTIEALQFAADHLNVAHKGVFQHIILVAPETETNVSSTLDKIMLIGSLPIFFNSCMWQGFDTKISVFCIDVRTYHFSEKNYVQVFLSLNLPSIRKWNPNSTPKLLHFYALQSGTPQQGQNDRIYSLHSPYYIVLAAFSANE